MRHRKGRPLVRQVARATFDTRQRTDAHRLDRAASGWLVLWSYQRRAFDAYPQWDAPSGLILTYPDAGQLLAAMRAAEAQHTATSSGTGMDPLAHQSLPRRPG